MFVRSVFGSARFLLPHLGLFLVSTIVLAEKCSIWGQVRGVVINSETGQPLGRVEIVLSDSQSSDSRYIAITDDQGRFEMSAISSGSYQLMVSADQAPTRTEGERTRGTGDLSESGNSDRE